ncbi:triphosphatase [Scandinavium goeteborgense]|uniref:Triphosphatase n=1 Tax=Scandinavium goeteborgense TaxID=1851514 RepID=A0A4R6DSR7_SCAGO|nr:triphosphatase [Scandinavium goeteborgense]
MDQEIELKFIVEQDGVETLRTQLNALSAEHVPAAQLLNIYYETADNWLRRHDMGLRIRGHNGRYEMTMKIAGKVVGGLHSRPEYNIDLDKAELALEKLPAEVWPEGTLPPELASQVNPLFSTDFYREKWMVNHNQSRIELALDLGDVKAGSHQEPICELELELLHGQVEDILEVAEQLLSAGVLRQGSLSKAARGYHLAAGNAERVVKKADFTDPDNAALEAALAHWQYHEELWLRGNAKAKAEVLNAVEFIRASLQRDHEMASAQMAQIGDAISAATNAKDAAFKPQIAQAKLMLTAFLVTGR